MAWIIGSQQPRLVKPFNEVARELKGTLDDATAKITLAKFLKHNIGWTWEHISGLQLMEIQELILKGLFVNDNSMIVAGRGFSKSWLIAVFSILYSIFNPDKKICLISANFRSSRRILETCEKFLKGKKAGMLKACFGGDTTMKKGNDIVSWKMSNGAEIFALPLSNGEGLRGTRANCVLVDEGLLISQEIQETILRPFLTVKQDFREEAEVKAAEDFLIAEGTITEEDRISFPKNKFCVFSSASYEFQYLYSLYCQSVDFINNPDKVEVAPGEKPNKYFVVRASYEALPPNGIMDLSQINAAKAGGGENSEYFKREYRGLFSKTGEGYFSAIKLHKCTVPLLDYPTVQLKGEKDVEYIVSIDPSYSASKTSDDFAMGVYMLVPQQRKIILIHSYAQAGRDLKDHYTYFAYIMKFFNVVFICMDGSGTEFIHGFNESVLAKETNLNLKFLDVDFCSDEYLQEIAKAKNQYNQSTGKIIYAQTPTSQSNRLMNEHLQNQIDCEKVWFGSKLGANENEVKKLKDFKLPITHKNKNDQEMELSDFISEQDELVDRTKNQVALIEARASALGNLTYDLPQNLKRETGAHRTRKDSYMTLALAAWGARHLFEMKFAEITPVSSSFDPIFIS